MSVVTAARFARGMTFEQYLAFIGTPANLAREAGWWRGPERMDWSAILRGWHDGLRRGAGRRRSGGVNMRGVMVEGVRVAIALVMLVRRRRDARR